MKFLVPVANVVREELANKMVLETKATSPWRMTFLVEIVRVKASRIIAIRAEMIVNNVEYHRDPMRVGGIDQRAQIVRRAIHARRRVY